MSARKAKRPAKARARTYAAMERAYLPIRKQFHQMTKELTEHPEFKAREAAQEKAREQERQRKEHAAAIEANKLPPRAVLKGRILVQQNRVLHLVGILECIREVVCTSEPPPNMDAAISAAKELADSIHCALDPGEMTAREGAQS